MKTIYYVLPVLFLAARPGPGRADVIAQSVAEFSLTQGQNNWFYGFYNQTAHGLPYNPALFQPFDTPGVNRWEASLALVGGNPDNNPFLNLNPTGGHPTGIGPGGQDRILWAVRRYVSEVSGPVTIAYDLGKENTQNPNGGGVTGHLFVDGVELLNQFVANTNGTGFQGTFTVNVNAGSLIDFAIDPTGVVGASGDGAASARADGSRFTAVVSTQVAVPEPGCLVLLGLGLVAVARRLR